MTEENPFNSKELPKQLWDATEIVNVLERAGQWLGLLNLNWELVRFYHFASNLYTILWHVLHHTNLGCNRKALLTFWFGICHHVLHLLQLDLGSLQPLLCMEQLWRDNWTHTGSFFGNPCANNLTNRAPKEPQTQNMAALMSGDFLFHKGNVPDQIFNTWPGFTWYSLLLIEKSVLVLPSDIFSDGRNSSNNFQPKIWVAWALQQQQKAAGIRIAADNSPYPAMQLNCHSNPLSIHCLQEQSGKLPAKQAPADLHFCDLEMCSKNWH